MKFIKIFMAILLFFCVFFFVGSRLATIYSEIRQKELRANCGVNFERLKEACFSNFPRKNFGDYKCKEDLFTELQLKNESFIKLSKSNNFLDGIELSPTIKKNNSLEMYPLIYDKKFIHEDGKRHVLMSNGDIYFLTEKEFERLGKNR